MIEGLTKENFFNEMEEKYPKAMRRFKAWVNDYKTEINWEYLFNSGRVIIDERLTKSPKFHELPIAFQIGVFLQFALNIELPGDEISQRVIMRDNIEQSLSVVEKVTVEKPIVNLEDEPGTLSIEEENLYIGEDEVSDVEEERLEDEDEYPDFNENEDEDSERYL